MNERIQNALYVVATPIGNLEDISARALHILRHVDVIACEDTRHSAHLCQAYGIRTPLVAYHEHSSQAHIDSLLGRVQGGQSMALISDAGTPAISDPGFSLVRLAHAHRVKVIPVAGACAASMALSVSGLPSDRFLFVGFLPAKTVARQKTLASLIDAPTLIIYESPHRIQDSVQDMLSVLGERTVCFCRELSKTFETVWHGQLTDLPAFLDTPHQQKGEMVLIIGKRERSDDNAQALALARLLADELPLAKATSLAAKFFDCKKSVLYDTLSQNTPLAKDGHERS